MTDLDIYRKLATLKEQVEAIYDPKTAFGNLVLIQAMHQSAELKQILDETKECWNCRGHGYIEHECDCDKCNYEEDDCEECEDGRIPKTP